MASHAKAVHRSSRSFRRAKVDRIFHDNKNQGRCVHTAKYRPWTVDGVIEFADERRAVAFERYLKSGSGVAFARRHLR
jgi:hypothetical protein